MTTSAEKIIRDMLSRRDPSGNYVVLALSSNKARSILAQYNHLDVEDSGSIIIIKCKSRRVAEELTRKLLTRGVLITR